MERLEASLKFIKRILCLAGIHGGSVLRTNQIPLITWIEVILRSRANYIRIYNQNMNICEWYPVVCKLTVDRRGDGHRTSRTRVDMAQGERQRLKSIGAVKQDT